MNQEVRYVARVGAFVFLAARVSGPRICSFGSLRSTYGPGFRFNLSTKEIANLNMDHASRQEGASSVFGFAEAF